MDAAYSRRPSAVVQPDAMEARFIERIASRVASQRSARHLEEALVRVGWIALLSVQRDENRLPLWKQLVEWSMRSYLRKERRQSHPEISSDPRSRELNPEQQAILRQLWNADPLLVPIYGEGNSQAELARKMGVGQQHVSRKLQKAVTRARKLAA